MFLSFPTFTVAKDKIVCYNTSCDYAVKAGFCPRTAQEECVLPRFFVSADLLACDTPVLDGEHAAHIKVLRLSRGDSITLCDGCGLEAQCEIVGFADRQVYLQVQSRNPAVSEPSLQCSVYMGFPKSDKFEHVVQKATELGAAEIVIFPCERSISRPDAKSLSKKLDRWQKIAVSAAEQSGRGKIPAVLALDSFDAAVQRACTTELPLLFYENERTRSLRTAAGEKAFSSAAIMTGPEGGLTLQEVEKAMNAGMQVCSLGPRILRCETAPLCALSALLYHTGDLD